MQWTVRLVGDINDSSSRRQVCRPCRVGHESAPRRPGPAGRPHHFRRPACADDESLARAGLQNFQIITTIHAAGGGVLMVEQNAAMALSMAGRGYVLPTGHIVFQAQAAELLRDEELKRAYLGRWRHFPAVPGGS